MINNIIPLPAVRVVFRDNAKVEALNKRYVPKDTNKKNTFGSWRDKRNKHIEAHTSC